MCGCGARIMSQGLTMDEVIQDASLRNDLSQYKMISRTDFNNGKTLSILQVAFCMDAQQFLQIFRNVGMSSVNGGDLPDLAVMIDNGDDVKGKLLNDNNQPIYINIMQEVRKMRISGDQVSQAQCGIAFV